MGDVVCSGRCHPGHILRQAQDERAKGAMDWLNGETCASPLANPSPIRRALAASRPYCGANSLVPTTPMMISARKPICTALSRSPNSITPKMVTPTAPSPVQTA